MEYTGRISRLFEPRKGISKRTGQPWKALPFIFEFFDSEEDKYASFAKLETFNTDIMAKIAKFVVKDEEGKAIIKDGCMDMTKSIEVKCNIKLYLNIYKDNVYNEIVLKDMEILNDSDEQANSQVTAVHENKQGGSFDELTPATPEDDLPF
jgi:hypothetical protein